MSEIPSPPDAADALMCANCNRPVGPVHYRAMGRAMCPQCAQIIASLEQFNRFAAGPFFMGALAGLGAAIAVAFVWALVAKLTGYHGGLIAIFFGAIVSFAVLKGSGGRRGAHMQALAICLSLFGIWVGKGLCATWPFYDMLSRELNMTGESPLLNHLFLFALGALTMVGVTDLLWYGFAIYDSWRRLRPLRIPIEGPFSSRPSPQAGALQFDSVEPAHAEPGARTAR